jgi:hypothetical protein
MQALGRNPFSLWSSRGMISYDRQPLSRRSVKRRQIVIGLRLDVSSSTRLR